MINYIALASYIGTACGIASTGALVYKKTWFGCTVGIIGSVLYIFLGFKTGLYALIVSNVFYIGLYFHGILKEILKLIRKGK